MSILLVEQNARLVLQVAQRGYVMESGTITLPGAATAEIQLIGLMTLRFLSISFAGIDS